MANDPHPEADRLSGAPHPRTAARLFGQAAAEQSFLEAHASGRLPHAWLLTGPKGVGKATFAWRAARFLLADPRDEGGLFGASEPPQTLDVAADHPVAHRMVALSEPGLCLIRRPWDDKLKRLKTQVTVDEVRNLKSFFSMSAGGNGRRIVIVDSADEMNTSAANALLKELEEPPRDAILFLVTHRPSALLPTIRSRCRPLRFKALDEDSLGKALQQAGLEPVETMAGLAALVGGSVGEAVKLMSTDGVALYEQLLGLIGSMPGFDRALALRLSDTMAGKDGAERFDLMLTLLDRVLSQLARYGSIQATSGPTMPDETALLERLAPSALAGRAWADLAATLTARARQGKAVNLDPAALTFDMFLDLDRTAARLPA